MLVLTDSGGIQDETTALSVPCLTLRESTECPVTVVDGTNEIVERELKKILNAVGARKRTSGKRNTFYNSETVTPRNES